MLRYVFMLSFVVAVAWAGKSATEKLSKVEQELWNDVDKGSWPTPGLIPLTQLEIDFGEYHRETYQPHVINKINPPLEKRDFDSEEFIPLCKLEIDDNFVTWGPYRDIGKTVLVQMCGMQWEVSIICIGCNKRDASKGVTIPFPYGSSYLGVKFLSKDPSLEGVMVQAASKFCTATLNEGPKFTEGGKMGKSTKLVTTHGTRQGVEIKSKLAMIDNIDDDVRRIHIYNQIRLTFQKPGQDCPCVIA